MEIKLNKTLAFNQHPEEVKNKLKTRNNNIISKLAGTSLGSRENILRTSALALVYNAAEYCTPVWEINVYTRKMNIEINNTMRMISGCVKSTKVKWLLDLSNIVPPKTGRHAATVKLLQLIQNSTNLTVLAT